MQHLLNRRQAIRETVHHLPPPDYSPPTSAEMRNRQNDDHALRLLIAQRRLYSRAKRWLGIRWFGMLVIGLAAPVISVIWPPLAVVAGAIAGFWIFIGRTVLVLWQSSSTTKAAAIQEQFDFYVFNMPASIDRPTLPTIEEVATIAGPDADLRASAAKEKLLDWYAIDATDAGTSTVAISQRANVSYSDRLLRTTATVWAAATALWGATLVVASSLVGLSLSTFLIGVFLPILPAFLDVVEYVFGIWKAARERREISSSIEQHLKSNNTIDGKNLLAWQEQLYDVRRTTPQVPDLVYKLKRRTNERAMKAAASQLGQDARRRLENP